MRPGPTTSQLRRLMALLTVLAAFMFQVRIEVLSAWRLSEASEQHVGHCPLTDSPAPSFPHHLHHHGAASAAPEPERTPQEHSRHDHSAHCPFCVTNAFGAEVAVPQAPRPPEAYWSTPFAIPPQINLLRIRHADPRAPPLFL